MVKGVETAMAKMKENYEKSMADLKVSSHSVEHTS